MPSSGPLVLDGLVMLAPFPRGYGVAYAPQRRRRACCRLVFKGGRGVLASLARFQQLCRQRNREAAGAVRKRRVSTRADSMGLARWRRGSDGGQSPAAAAI